MSTQNPNDIMQVINNLVQSTVGTPIATAPIPALNYTLPNAGALPGKFQEFLDRASKDPDIIRYYQQLLDFAKGDTELAKQQLENDYRVGTRQTTDTLSANLKQLGLTFGEEAQAKEAELNKRGIAMTDVGGGKTAYAAGGQPATELEQLSESQKLRQEAEQRSAAQKIEGLGITRQKGLQTAGQNLQNTALQLRDSQQKDIYNRAQIGFGAQQAEESLKANKAFQEQQLAIQRGQGGGSGPYGGYGSKNEWFHAKTGGEIAPVGWNG